MKTLEQIAKEEGYTIHPAAALFPMLPEKELKALAADIKKNGLIHPIVLHEKQILDGRNRLMACHIANVGVYFRSYKSYSSGHTPTEYVLAVNLKRRQLTPSQKAAAASHALPMLRAEARERQRMGRERIPDPGKKGKATERAAELSGANARYVQNAERIKQESPKLFKEVEAGAKTIPQAMKELARSAWEFNKIPAPAEHHPDDDDSAKLFHTKRAWRKMGKKDRAAFWQWVLDDASGSKGGWDTFRQTCKLIRERIATMPRHAVLSTSPAENAVRGLINDFANKIEFTCEMPKCGKPSKRAIFCCGHHGAGLLKGPQSKKQTP